jgi:hypothetical protein
MYDFSHPIADALEGITHSLCSLEFEDHRPFYEWTLQNLYGRGIIESYQQKHMLQSPCLQLMEIHGLSAVPVVDHEFLTCIQVPISPS